jgi:hypothetical protein
MTIPLAFSNVAASLPASPADRPVRPVTSN